MKRPVVLLTDTRQWMHMEFWWNENERGKNRNTVRKKRSLCHNLL